MRVFFPNKKIFHHKNLIINVIINNFDLDEIYLKLSIFAMYLIDYKYVKKENSQIKINWLYRRKKKENSCFVYKLLSRKEYFQKSKK